MNCPNCAADVSDSYEEDDPSTGIIGGWYCEVCDLGICDERDDGDYDDFWC
jgi:hypothetical protein